MPMLPTIEQYREALQICLDGLDIITCGHAPSVELECGDVSASIALRARRVLDPGAMSPSPFDDLPERLREAADAL
jgi:hypothetical protein